MMLVFFSVNVPGEPQNLVVDALSPDSVKVTWDPPANEDGPISKYKVFYYMVCRVYNLTFFQRIE